MCLDTTTESSKNDNEVGEDDDADHDLDNDLAQGIDINSYEILDKEKLQSEFKREQMEKYEKYEKLNPLEKIYSALPELPPYLYNETCKVKTVHNIKKR